MTQLNPDEPRRDEPHPHDGERSAQPRDDERPAGADADEAVEVEHVPEEASDLEPDERDERDEPGGDDDAESVEEPGEDAEQSDLMSEVTAQRDQYLDLLQRERAEFENYRKRANRERMEALDRGAEQLCSELLLVLDNFGYTLQAAQGSSDERLAKGVEMVHQQLVDVLTTTGLQEVPGAGATFDPTVHEAVETADASEALGHEVDEPVVVEVLRPGYRFKDRLLRPASVKVAK